MAGSRPVSLPVALAPLAPFETRYVDFADALKNLGLDQLSGNANLLFSFTGRRGDLVLWSGSVDQTANYVFAVVPEGVGKSFGKASGYWTVAHGFDTMYTVFNPTSQAEDVVATFHFGDGSGQYELPIHLDAQGSTTLDLMDLIEAARPDAHGKVIPKTMPNGGVVFESVAGRAKWMTLVVSAGVYNAHRATCGTVCTQCYGFTNFDVLADPWGVPVTQTVAMHAQATYADGNVDDFTASSTWSSNNTSIASIGATTGVATGNAVGNATLFAQYPTLVEMTGEICGNSYPTCPTRAPQPSAGGDVDGLTCGATSGSQGGVTRAATVNCTVNNLPSGGTVSGWSFTDGTNTVATSSTSSSWSGTAVQSGTVSVTATYNGTAAPLSAALTVNARTNFAFTAVSPVKVANGSAVCLSPATPVTLASPPAAPSGGSNETVLGFSCLTLSFSFNGAVVSGGPNDQYKYVSSVSSTNSSNNVATTFNWLRVPDLDSATSTFYASQCGNYNASTNPNGFISGASLAAQVQRHEAGSAASHWSNYTTSQATSGNNIGTKAESEIDSPSTSSTTFLNSVTTDLNSIVTTVTNATSSENIPGANYDASGNFLGYVNYQPYAPCN